MPRYWALAVNPKNYRILDAVRERREAVWSIGRSKIAAGDRVAIWKTLGGVPKERGIVALGEVIRDPEEMDDAENPYWLNRQMASASVPRVVVRYQPAPNLPLLVGGDQDDLLLRLSVADAQGGTAFKIDESDWVQLVEAAGASPAAEAAQPSAQTSRLLTETSPPQRLGPTDLALPDSLSRRQALIHQLAALAGPGLAEVLDARDGWPGLLRLRLPSGPVTLAVHAGEIGLSHRDRDRVERRFQNPGQGRPMSAPMGAFPLLLGLWQGDRGPLLVGMEAPVRMARQTRQSLFIPLSLLERAETGGWAEHVSGSGELLIAFHPALLPVYVEARRAEVSLPTGEVAEIAAAAGLTTEGESPAERARRVASALVRRTGFSQRVLAAYDDLCAMCDLDLGLVVGAHIYPVEAPASQDQVWNGLALCGNHHAAFDRHRVWIEPLSLRIKVHHEILDQTGRNPACRSFVETTRRELRLPREPAMAPRAEMLTMRYEFYTGRYGWATR